MVKPLTSKNLNEKRDRTTVLVAVSALALISMPYRGALAQTVSMSCSKRYSFGQQIACSDGSLSIDPDGSTSLSGCLSEQAPPQAGSCTLRVIGGTATRNVRVQFTAPTFNAKMGADQVTIKSLRMQERGQPSTAAQLTFTPLELTSPVTIDIGGTTYFSGNQPSGNYSGGIVIDASFI